MEGDCCAYAFPILNVPCITTICDRAHGNQDKNKLAKIFFELAMDYENTTTVEPS